MSDRSSRRTSEDKTITAENSFTDAIAFDPQTVFDLTADVGAGTTVHLQRSFDAGVTWYDVESFTADAEKLVGNSGKTTLWRAGVKTGNYGASTYVRIGQ